MNVIVSIHSYKRTAPKSTQQKNVKLPSTRMRSSVHFRTILPVMHQAASLISCTPFICVYSVCICMYVYCIPFRQASSAENQFLHSVHSNAHTHTLRTRHHMHFIGNNNSEWPAFNGYLNSARTRFEIVLLLRGWKLATISLEREMHFAHH